MPEEIQIEMPADMIARLTTERDHAILRAEQAEQSVELLLGDVENLQVALRVERRKVTTLRAEIEKQAVEGKFAKSIEEVFAFWQFRCGHPRAKLGAKRATAIRARLIEGYSVEEIREAIDGAALDPFVKDGRRYDDIELICRDETKLESFMKRRKAWIQRVQQHHGEGYGVAL